jgi:hypothetical protein
MASDGGESEAVSVQVADAAAPDVGVSTEAAAEATAKGTDATGDAGAPPASDAGIAIAADAGREAGAGAVDPPADAAFAGEYKGEDVAVVRLQGMPDKSERDPNARIQVVDGTNGAMTFTLINSANGSPLCALRGKRAGSSATVEAGQTCFADGAADGKVDSGSATFSGKRLTLDLKVTVTLTMPSGSISGGIDYHFDGTRR